LDLEFFPENLKKNKQIAIFALKVNGFSLKYIDETLKNDKEIVLIAV
jgi:hypothetical protein